jgi:hypothetical protein
MGKRESHHTCILVTLKKINRVGSLAATSTDPAKAPMVLSRGINAVTVSDYWQKPLIVTALAVIKFY